MGDAIDGTSTTFLWANDMCPLSSLRIFPAMDDVRWRPPSQQHAVGGAWPPIAQGPYDGTSSFYAFGSWHVGGSQFVFLDGSVRNIAVNVDTISLGQLSNRANSVIEVIHLEE